MQGKCLEVSLVPNNSPVEELCFLYDVANMEKERGIFKLVIERVFRYFLEELAKYAKTRDYVSQFLD